MSKVQTLRDMPQEMQPTRDLWLGIEPRLKRRTWLVPTSLAASVVIALVGFWAGMQMRGNDQQLAGRPASVALVRTALGSDPAYTEQRQALLRALPEKLDQLPPESRQRVQESLQNLQQAITAIEAELGRDAGNVLLQELLISTSQEEMRVLTVVGTADGMNGGA